MLPNEQWKMERLCRFAYLLEPIRDLTKNWEVDVAGQLDEYLSEVRECVSVCLCPCVYSVCACLHRYKMSGDMISFSTLHPQRQFLFSVYSVLYRGAREITSSLRFCSMGEKLITV